MVKKEAIASFLFFAATFALGTRLTHAAFFQFTPGAFAVDSGSRFAVTVSLDSEGTAVNSAEGIFSFNSRYLSVESISTAESVFRFWVQEPVFSNAAGTISFGGGLPAPGYKGSNGKIFKIVFLASGVGESSLKLNSGAILANDGVGTNVLNGSPQGFYEIKAGRTASPQLEIIEPIVGKIFEPVITSATHPDKNIWYNTSEFRASWDLPEGVAGVNFVLWSSSFYNLPKKNKGLAKETFYDLKDLKDGIWYFFARFYSPGGWGPIVRHEVRIDRTPPEDFGIRRIDSNDPTNPAPLLRFTAKDETSGIDHYEIKIDEGDFQKTSGSDYAMPKQSPGKHVIRVRVYDAAGNYRESSFDASVEPIEKPQIISYSEEVNFLAPDFKVEGKAAPRLKILGRLAGKEKVFEFSGSSDEAGFWSMEKKERWPRGNYLLTFVVEDDRGALSLETTPLPVRVTMPLERIVDFVLSYFSLGTVVLLIAVISFILASYFGKKRQHDLLLRDLSSFEKKLKENIGRIKKDLEKSHPGVSAGIKKLENDLDREFKNLKRDV